FLHLLRQSTEMTSLKCARNLKKYWLMAAAMAAAPVTKVAALPNWTFAGSGSWTVASNWLGGVPTSSNNINIVHAVGVNRTITYDYTGASILFATMSVENTGTGSALFSQSANTFNSANETIGTGGTGYFILSGGAHNVTASGASGMNFGSNATGKGIGTISG